MSQSDSFLREVTDEVRRDRMFRLWRRYSPYVIGALALVVAAGALLSWTDRRAEQTAREQMGEFRAILEDLESARAAADGEAAAAEGEAEAVSGEADTPPEAGASALEALRAFAGDADEGYALLARFRAAAALLEAEDPEAAVGIYEQLAAERGIPAVYRDLAALKAAVAAGAGKRADRLRPLAEGDNVYRLLAKEVLAGELLSSGAAGEALALFDEILDEPDASRLMRARITPLREIALARAAPDDAPGEE